MFNANIIFTIFASVTRRAVALVAVVTGRYTCGPITTLIPDTRILANGDVPDLHHNTSHCVMCPISPPTRAGYLALGDACDVICVIRAEIIFVITSTYGDTRGIGHLELIQSHPTFQRRLYGAGRIRADIVTDGQVQVLQEWACIAGDQTSSDLKPSFADTTPIKCCHSVGISCKSEHVQSTELRCEA